MMYLYVMPGPENPRAKRVLVSGVVYNCMKDAANAINIKPNTLRARFARYLKNDNFPTGWGYLPMENS